MGSFRNARDWPCCSTNPCPGSDLRYATGLHGTVRLYCASVAMIQWIYLISTPLPSGPTHMGVGIKNIRRKTWIPGTPAARCEDNVGRECG